MLNDKVWPCFPKHSLLTFDVLQVKAWINVTHPLKLMVFTFKIDPMTLFCWLWNQWKWLTNHQCEDTYRETQEKVLLMSWLWQQVEYPRQMLVLVKLGWCFHAPGFFLGVGFRTYNKSNVSDHSRMPRCSNWRDVKGVASDHTATWCSSFQLSNIFFLPNYSTLRKLLPSVVSSTSRSLDVAVNKDKDTSQAAAASLTLTASYLM